jgi:hypothetical protein
VVCGYLALMMLEHLLFGQLVPDLFSVQISKMGEDQKFLPLTMKVFSLLLWIKPTVHSFSQ